MNKECLDEIVRAVGAAEHEPVSGAEQSPPLKLESKVMDAGENIGNKQDNVAEAQRNINRICEKYGFEIPFRNRYSDDQFERFPERTQCAIEGLAIGAVVTPLYGLAQYIDRSNILDLETLPQTIVVGSGIALIYGFVGAYAGAGLGHIIGYAKSRLADLRGIKGLRGLRENNLPLITKLPDLCMLASLPLLAATPYVARPVEYVLGVLGINGLGVVFGAVGDSKRRKTEGKKRYSALMDGLKSPK